MLSDQLQRLRASTWNEMPSSPSTTRPSLVESNWCSLIYTATTSPAFHWRASRYRPFGEELYTCTVVPTKNERCASLQCLQDLLNLRFLMLGHNQIGSLKPQMFAGMRNLSDLDLPLNALTTLPSNAFKPLIALKVLDLSLNRIQKISPKAFIGLRQLMFLNLDNNRSSKLSFNGLFYVLCICVCELCIYLVCGI